jgi:hypothetical protein
MASLEDLFGLEVAAVGEVDIRLGHRVDVADGVELAEPNSSSRTTRRWRRGCRYAGRPLAPEEGIRLQPALEERRLAAVLAGPRAHR